MRYAVGHGHDPVVELNKQLGVLVQAYSPLAKGQLAKDALCARIGKGHGKSAVQVALKWILQHGAAIATQSTSPLVTWESTSPLVTWDRHDFGKALSI